jgi:hypothetical protein
MHTSRSRKDPFVGDARVEEDAPSRNRGSKVFIARNRMFTLSYLQKEVYEVQFMPCPFFGALTDAVVTLSDAFSGGSRDGERAGVKQSGSGRRTTS